MTRFPLVLHVTFHTDPAGGFFEVHPRGCADVERSGEKVALYRRVEVGSVRIQKTFVTSRRKKARK